MSAQRNALNEFLHLDKLVSYAKLVFKILPNPTKRTMEIIDNGHEVNPMAFMLFGLGIFSATAFTQPVIITGKFAFLNSLVWIILLFLSFITYAGVQYKILKDVSHTNRTFDNYLVMTALVGGMYYILVGSAFIILMLHEVIGLLVTLIASVYMIVYGLKTSQRFWEISIGKVFLYSFLSTLAATLLILLVSFIIGVVIGITGILPFDGKAQDDKGPEVPLVVENKYPGAGATKPASVRIRIYNQLGANQVKEDVSITIGRVTQSISIDRYSPVAYVDFFADELGNYDASFNATSYFKTQGQVMPIFMQGQGRININQFQNVSFDLAADYSSNPPTVFLQKR